MACAVLRGLGVGRSSFTCVPNVKEGQGPFEVCSQTSPFLSIFSPALWYPPPAVFPSGRGMGSPHLGDHQASVRAGSVQLLPPCFWCLNGHFNQLLSLPWNLVACKDARQLYPPHTMAQVGGPSPYGDASHTGGGGAVIVLWKISCFKLAAKFPTPAKLHRGCKALHTAKLLGVPAKFAKQIQRLPQNFMQ